MGNRTLRRLFDHVDDLGWDSCRCAFGLPRDEVRRWLTKYFLFRCRDHFRRENCQLWLWFRRVNCWKILLLIQRYLFDHFRWFQRDVLERCPSSFGFDVLQGFRLGNQRIATARGPLRDGLGHLR
uniref:(northern house mosquito) hypothetical protein n=1 Tax=Culex pipiens TaxID=7175 RepID=A0A8D8FNC4_CULPI